MASIRRTTAIGAVVETLPPPVRRITAIGAVVETLPPPVRRITAIGVMIETVAILVKTPAPGAYATAGAVLIETAATQVSNSFIAAGNEVLIVHNTGAGARTYTITSVADEKGRLGHITAQSIDAGAIHIYGPMAQDGWRQADGRIYVAGSHAEVKFGVITLPGY